MPADSLTPAGVVEEFESQFDAHTTLPDVMPLPMVVVDSGVIELTMIGVYDEHQGNGFASSALRMLTALCDANGLAIRPVARPLLHARVRRVAVCRPTCVLVPSG
jgi:hypothetical protein